MIISKLTISQLLQDKSKLALWQQLLNSKNIESVLTQLAYITHYIQNKGDNNLPYQEQAIELIKKVTSFNITDNVDEFLNLPFFSEINCPIFKARNNTLFRFIDLFSGIGGFRLAFQNVGGKCVFSSEWDIDAQKTYYHNFGEIPFGDITDEKVKACIPQNIDILCAGFPCQAFSIAGYRKGFEDTRGTLFFDVATIIKRHKPKAFMLENVKNLQTHDHGRTYKIIIETLENIGYKVYSKVMNTMEYANIPQNRERIFIVGFDPNQVLNYNDFEFPSKIQLNKNIHDCIDLSVNDELYFYRETQRYYPFLVEAMKNKDTVYQWRRQYVRENQSNVCPTLTANMGMGGHNVPLIITNNGFRKLTPKECLNFQGYPVNYSFPLIAQSKCYKQAGNSVTVPLIQRIASKIVEIL